MRPPGRSHLHKAGGENGERQSLSRLTRRRQHRERSEHVACLQASLLHKAAYEEENDGERQSLRHDKS